MITVTQKFLFLATATLTLGGNLRAQEIAKETLNTRLAVLADQELITTSLAVPVPFIREHKTLEQFIKQKPATSRDEALIGLFKAVLEKRADDLSKFIDLSNFEVTDASQLRSFLEESYFEPDVELVLAGKIPMENGCGYALCRKNKDLPGFLILAVVSTPNGDKVQAVTSNKLVNVIQKSLASYTLDELDKGLVRVSSPPLGQAQNDLLRTRIVTDEATKNELAAAVRNAVKSELKAGFTSYSQGKVNDLLAEMNEEQKREFVSRFAEIPQDIEYIVNLSPLYITKQHSNRGSNPLLYFYKDPSSGQMLLTNFNRMQPFDEVVSKLKSE